MTSPYNSCTSSISELVSFYFSTLISEDDAQAIPRRSFHLLLCWRNSLAFSISHRPTGSCSLQREIIDCASATPASTVALSF